MRFKKILSNGSEIITTGLLSESDSSHFVLKDEDYSVEYRLVVIQGVVTRVALSTVVEMLRAESLSLQCDSWTNQYDQRMVQNALTSVSRKLAESNLFFATSSSGLSSRNSHITAKEIRCTVPAVLNGFFRQFFFGTDFLLCRDFSKNVKKKNRKKMTWFFWALHVENQMYNHKKGSPAPGAHGDFSVFDGRPPICGNLENIVAPWMTPRNNKYF
jgi:hypothetical protein